MNTIDSTSHGNTAQVDSEQARQNLEAAISAYVKPIKQEQNSAAYSPGLNKGGPMDVNFGGIFTSGSRHKAEARLAKANNKFASVNELVQAIHSLLTEFDTPMSQATFREKFAFRMRFLRVIFSLPKGNDQLEKDLRDAFEKFLETRKRIDLSHF